MALRDDWQQALLTVKESIGFKRVRFHGLLDDDMGLVQSKTLLRNITTIKKNNDHNVKNYILNFTKIQQVFDFLIYEANVMPYIELGAILDNSSVATNSNFFFVDEEKTSKIELERSFSFLASGYTNPSLLHKYFPSP